ncbi:MAG: glycosyltransferase family 39 protein [Nitrospinae bacterium]|nr:glycosyltransferase family 39 protein [Nitrospinota bacterium]
MLALSVFRFFYSGLTELTPDEAYYWEWSRYLQLSYYDHPPMVAYMIFLSTWIGGATEKWVRFPGVITGIGISLAAYFMGRDLFKSEKTGLYSAIFVNMVLMVSIGCFIITPDTPQGLFTAWTLYFFFKALELERLSWWALSGACLGAAMLSKYTGVLLVSCILITLATWPGHRKWFFRKELYIAAGVAFLFTLPVLAWNHQNGWISIAFQSKHGFSGLDVNPLAGFLDFIGTQFGLLTPFVFLSALSTMIYCFFHGKENFRYHFIFWNSAPILLFFCAMSMRQKIEGNWASLAYFVSLVGAVGVYFELREAGLRGWRTGWANFLKKTSIATSLIILGFVYIHAIVPIMSLPKNLDVTRRLHGWKTLSGKVDEIMGQFQPGSPPPFVFGDRHQINSELSFYLKGQPVIYKTGGAARYSYIKDFSHLMGKDAVYVAEKARVNIKSIGQAFERVDEPVSVTIWRADRIIWDFVIIRCYHYNGGLIGV